MDCKIPVRSLDISLNNKKKNGIWWILMFQRNSNENKRKRKDTEILGPFQRAKNANEQYNDGDTNCSWGYWDGLRGIRKETERSRGYRYREDCSTITTNKNTKKSPGNLRKLAVSQNHVNNYELKRLWTLVKSEGIKGFGLRPIEGL